MANTVHIVNIPQLLFEKACAAKYELNTAQTKLNFFDARKFCMIIILLSNGTPCTIRTCDPRLRRPMLYPAELRAQKQGGFFVRFPRTFGWSHR